MLDERTKQAISFLDSIHNYAADATKVDCALHILDFLNKNRKYTPYSRVLISKQLVYNILDAEVGIAREREEARGSQKCTSIFDSEGEGRPRADIVEKTWQRIYERYPAKGIYSMMLNEKLICEIIEIAADILIERFDNPSKEEPKPKKEPVPPEDPVEAFKEQERERVLRIRSNLEDEAEQLFMLNKNEEAMEKFEEALNFADEPYSIYGTYLNMAARMTRRNKLGEAIQFLYRGITYLQSFVVSGKPMMENREDDLLMDFPIIKDNGESITSYSLFNEIQSAIFLLEYIPEEEATMPERKRIYNIISSIVLQLEEWQSKKMVE